VSVAEQIQLRCSNCYRRLADYVNEIREGSLLIEIKCKACDTINSVPLKGKTAI
jgi:phage FluMu protein Com